jgi:hypothetical protein
MPNVLKFTHGSTNIYFDQEEVGEETVQFLQDLSVNESQTQAPTIHYDGNEYNIISVTFYEKDFSGTLDKINALKAVTAELTFYYRYGYDGGVASLKVVPVIDNDTEVWVYGEKSAEVTHTMQFLLSGA